MKETVTLPSENHKELKLIKRWLILSAAIFIIVVFNFMEPFGININGFVLVYHLVLSSYGLVSALTVWLVLKWFPNLMPTPQNNQFVSKLMLWMLLLLFLLSFSNWFYSQILRLTISGWHNMYVPIYKFSELMPQFLAIYSLWGLLSGCFVYFFLKHIHSMRSQQEINNNFILLPSDNQSDTFKVKPSHLVCLKTSDNYLEVYYLNEQQELQNRMIRSSMKKMEESLDEQLFFRPHQSYLVNLAYIKGLKKKQNNHFLEMAYLNFDVAISRKNVRHMKAHVVN